MRSSSRKTPIHLKCTTALINHPQRARAVAAATRRARIRAKNLEWAVQKVLWPRGGEKKMEKEKEKGRGDGVARYRVVEVQVQRPDEGGCVQGGEDAGEKRKGKGRGERDRNMEGAENAGVKKKKGKGMGNRAR